MATYNAMNFLSVVGLTTDDLSEEKTEKIIDIALGNLNLYNAELADQMTGTAGNKTVGLDPAHWAAVARVAKMIYVDFIEDAGGDMNVQGISLKASNTLSKPENEAIIKELAFRCSRVDSNPYDELVLL